MPTYKLIYFDLRARAELARFVFAQAGVAYEDVRIKPVDWPATKPTTPFGCLPVLEVDGKQLGGSPIIPRYLAELPEFNLAGKNEFENAEIAAVVDALGDIVSREMATVFFEEDEEKMKEFTKKFVEETLPKKLPFIEQRAATNDKGWLFGTSVTWADFSMYIIGDFILNRVTPDAFKDWPALTKQRASVEALPNIAKWLKERPDNKL